MASCLIGAALIGSMILIMVGNRSADNNFQKMLDPAQAKVFGEIRHERLMLFVQGLALGAVLAATYTYTMGVQDRLMRGCAIAAIVLGTAWLYYQLRAKKMILDYLNHPAQVKAWTELYGQYRYRSTLGMILGIAGVFLVALTF